MVIKFFSLFSIISNYYIKRKILQNFSLRDTSNTFVIFFTFVIFVTSYVFNQLNLKYTIEF